MNIFSFFKGDPGYDYIFYSIRPPFNKFCFHPVYTQTYFQQLYNMNLPREIIIKILQYCSIPDLLHCCIAKLFLPTLLDMPWFFETLNQYVCHVLANHHLLKLNLIANCAFKPVILNSTFYLALDQRRIPYLSRFLPNRLFELYSDIIHVISLIFNSYSFYAKFIQFHKLKLANVFNSFNMCHDRCPCKRYEYVQVVRHPHILIQQCYCKVKI